MTRSNDTFSAARRSEEIRRIPPHSARFCLSALIEPEHLALPPSADKPLFGDPRNGGDNAAALPVEGVDVRGRALDCGHTLQEEAPEETLGAIGLLNLSENRVGTWT